MVLGPEHLGDDRRGYERRDDGHQDDDGVELGGHRTGRQTDGCDDYTDLSPGNHTESDDVEGLPVQRPVSHLGTEAASDVLADDGEGRCSPAFRR